MSTNFYLAAKLARLKLNKDLGDLDKEFGAIIYNLDFTPTISSAEATNGHSRDNKDEDNDDKDNDNDEKNTDKLAKAIFKCYKLILKNYSNMLDDNCEGFTISLNGNLYWAIVINKDSFFDI